MLCFNIHISISTNFTFLYMNYLESLLLFHQSDTLVKVRVWLNTLAMYGIVILYCNVYCWFRLYYLAVLGYHLLIVSLDISIVLQSRLTVTTCFLDLQIILEVIDI